MNDIAFSVIVNNAGTDDIIFKTMMLKGEKGDKGDAGGAEIDDSTTSLTKAWSSSKINSEISAMPDNLSELDDVNFSNLSDEQLLGYNFNTGKWNNKTINASTLKYDNNTSIKSKIDAKANSADLATVATSGSYNDLSDKPDLLVSKEGVGTLSAVNDTVQIPTDVLAKSIIVIVLRRYGFFGSITISKNQLTQGTYSAGTQVFGDNNNYWKITISNSGVITLIAISGTAFPNVDCYGLL